MKLGLIAALTGIAVAIGLSSKKRSDGGPATRRTGTPAPPKHAPITGTAPQEGTNATAAPPSPGKADDARVAVP